MENYEKFKARNANWDCDSYFHTENEFEKNYAIALQVEKVYNENFPNINEPQIGDVVEFTDGYRVYKHALIVEDYCGDGKLCICACGCSHTDGKYFSTSGGSFVRKDKSELSLAGEDYNVVWTWGCHGAGASQGIYFPLKVRRWIIPYNPQDVRRSIIYFKKDEDGKVISVSIANSDSLWSCGMSFNSLKAFEAWANYVGYRYYIEGERGFSPQAVKEKCWTTTVSKPSGGKPIKVFANGDVRDGIAVTDDFTVTQWWPNFYRERPAYGSPEYEKEFAERSKYMYNPLGV